MVDIITTVIEPAKEVSFLSEYEARLALNMMNASDENTLKMIAMLLQWCSDEIATTCNRSFARETVEDTFRNINCSSPRLFLTHWPIVSITSVMGKKSDGSSVTFIPGTDYEVDAEEGELLLLGGNWSDPILVTYTGGYELPKEAPPALKQAATLMTREGYYASIRGDATIRMVGHKEARVIYFDPNALAKAAGGGSAGMSPARRAVADLLTSYTRWEI
jgi:hypothetical protein